MELTTPSASADVPAEEAEKQEGPSTAEDLPAVTSLDEASSAPMTASISSVTDVATPQAGVADVEAVTADVVQPLVQSEDVSSGVTAETAEAPAVSDAPSEPTEATEQPTARFDWTSVDCYHAEAPNCDALGCFEYRWYVCHNYYDTGRAIASLQPGDLLCVDGVLLQMSWMYYGTYGMTYRQARSIVGDDSYCFQTCTTGDGICVAVCYPA